MSHKGYYLPASLLTTNNAKTIKGEKKGWKTYILYMSPFTQNSQGKNVCPMATVGCSLACLYSSGKGSMSTVQKGRKNKTEFFLKDREAFLNTIYIEVATIELKHKLEKTKFVVRLNGTSDISWEKFIIKATGKNIFDSFPNVVFYDYTKNYLRFKNKLPKNYRLIFSRSETNNEMAMALLEKGINTAMVFDKVPKKYNGYKVIDGDLSDLRHLDPKGVIIGLKYKKLTGKGANNETAFENGFAIKVAA